MESLLANGIEDYLASLTDEQLLKNADMAHADVIKAAEEDRNSEWHAECFAGLFYYCTEMNRRGLKSRKYPVK